MDMLPVWIALRMSKTLLLLPCLRWSRCSEVWVAAKAWSRGSPVERWAGWPGRGSLLRLGGEELPTRAGRAGGWDLNPLWARGVWAGGRCGCRLWAWASPAPPQSASPLHRTSLAGHGAGLSRSLRDSPDPAQRLHYAGTAKEIVKNLQIQLTFLFIIYILILNMMMTWQLKKHMRSPSLYDRVSECYSYKRQPGMSTSAITSQRIPRTAL